MSTYIVKHNFLREHIILERKEKWARPPFLLELHKQINGVEQICSRYWSEVQKRLKDGECTLALVGIPWIQNGVLLVQDILDLEDSAFIRTDTEVKYGKLTNVKIFVGCNLSGKEGKTLFYKNFAHELTHTYDYLERQLEQRSVAHPGYGKALTSLEYPKSQIEAELAEIAYSLSRPERQAHFGSIRSELESKYGDGNSYWNNIKYCQKEIRELSYQQILQRCENLITGFKQISDETTMKVFLGTYIEIFGEVPMHGIIGDRATTKAQFKRAVNKLSNKVELTREQYEKTAAKVCADLRPKFTGDVYPGKRIPSYIDLNKFNL